LENVAHISLIEQLFKTYHAGLVAFADQYVRSPEDAREIVQDVFISVWNNRESIDREGNLKAYLFTATRNKCFNFLQKRKLSTVSIETTVVNPATEYGVEAQIDAAELRAEIYDEVRLLPEKCREIFLLSRRDGLSYKEIAQKLDVSDKTVENQIGIALKRIRRRLYPDQPGAGKGAAAMGALLFLALPQMLIEECVRMGFALFQNWSKKFGGFCLPAWGREREYLYI
jgi:RNA polymerase sigma-70 factor, ECF subfamily